MVQQSPLPTSSVHVDASHQNPWVWAHWCHLDAPGPPLLQPSSVSQSLKGETSVLLKSLVSCLQTFPSTATQAGFNQQILKKRLHTLLELYQYQLSQLLASSISLISRPDRKLCGNAEPQEVQGSSTSHPAVWQPCARASALLHDCKQFPPLLPLACKGQQLMSRQQKESCLWTTPEFWQHLTTYAKERNSLEDKELVAYCYESSSPSRLQ